VPFLLVYASASLEQADLVLDFKPAWWRNQDGRNEAEQHEHRELTVGESFS